MGRELEKAEICQIVIHISPLGRREGSKEGRIGRALDCQGLSESSCKAIIEPSGQSHNSGESSVLQEWVCCNIPAVYHPGREQTNGNTALEQMQGYI